MKQNHNVCWEKQRKRPTTYLFYFLPAKSVDKLYHTLSGEWGTTGLKYRYTNRTKSNPVIQVHVVVHVLE